MSNLIPTKPYHSREERFEDEKARKLSKDTLRQFRADSDDAQDDIASLEASVTPFHRAFDNVKRFRRPSILWQSARAFSGKRFHKGRKSPIDLTVTAQGIHLALSQDQLLTVRTSLKIAVDIANKEWVYNPPTVDYEAEHTTSFINATGGIERDISAARNAYQKEAEEAMGSRRPSVLYLNTLASNTSLANELIGVLPEVEAGIAHGYNQLPYKDLALELLTLAPGELLQKRAALIDLILRKNIAVLVLNSIEFACSTERQRRELVLLLKELRDMYAVTIVAFSYDREACASTTNGGRKTRGHIGSLAMLATSVSIMRDDMADAEIAWGCLNCDSCDGDE
jgi:hypothetical protein